nr:YfhO family protein [uncultured Blautia sp.]
MIFCNKTQKFTWRNALTLLLLLAAGSILIWLLIPSGSWFGSETDWYSQHVTIADYMRKYFYATGNLFPDFTGLGGGTNFFSLSYYGFMRPDVLVSYLFPHVETEWFIQGYAILEILLGGGLLYYWLHQKGFSDFTCFVCGFFYLCANCFFQAHRQIMFVNYLPFLILAFLCLDRIFAQKEQDIYRFRPHLGLIISLFFCVLHSFYFFPSCFVACILYICHLLPDYLKNTSDKKKKKLKHKIWWNYILDVSFAVAMNLFLLLPTGLAILGNQKDTGSSTSLLKILGVNPTLDSILYSPYGCGLTLFCLYALFLCIREKKTRKLAIAVFILLFFDIFYWILNATLYVRPKCLIPFLPLILYLTAQALEGLRHGKIRHSLPLALLCGIPVIVQLLFLIHNQQVRHIITADLILLLICVSAGIFMEEKGIKVPVGSWHADFCGLVLLLAIPAMLYLAKGQEEHYVTVADESRDYFSKEDLERYCENPQARFDVIEHPSNNTNYVITGNQNKSTLYSSISNSNYNKLIYDILQMPISIRNRVAMTADANPFQEYLMGVRYIQTKADKVPAGYTALQEKSGHILAENKNVLPIAYGSTALLSESDYDKLSYPQTLDTITNRTIVSDLSDLSAPYTSQMKEYSLPEDFFRHKTEKSSETLRCQLPQTLPGSTILLISFDVEYDGEKDISIIINGIRNRLSGSEAPYPNNNERFCYMISSNEELEALDITYSKGSYKIKNVQAYTIPLSALSHPGIVEFQDGSTSGKEIINGSIDMPENGYFVTSYTFSRGYTAYVDGKEVTPIQVNKAFLGFPLQKGAHEIQIEFHAPGKSLGFILSLTAAVLLILSQLGWRVISKASSTGSV